MGGRGRKIVGQDQSRQKVSEDPISKNELGIMVYPVIPAMWRQRVV
jgi:hypothetical protein